jgi:hypothetical protein
MARGVRHSRSHVNLQFGHEEMTTQKIVVKATSLRGFAHLVEQLCVRAGTTVRHTAGAVEQSGSKTSDDGKFGQSRGPRSSSVK